MSGEYLDHPDEFYYDPVELKKENLLRQLEIYTERLEQLLKRYDNCTL